jgi:hypothetical protein
MNKGIILVFWFHLLCCSTVILSNIYVFNYYNISGTLQCTSPITASHTRDRSPTSTIHAGDMKPTYESHVERKNLVNEIDTSNKKSFVVNHAHGNMLGMCYILCMTRTSVYIAS